MNQPKNNINNPFRPLVNRKLLNEANNIQINTLVFRTARLASRVKFAGRSICRGAKDHDYHHSHGGGPLIVEFHDAVFHWKINKAFVGDCWVISIVNIKKRIARKLRIIILRHFGLVTFQFHFRKIDTRVYLLG